MVRRLYETEQAYGAFIFSEIRKNITTYIGSSKYTKLFISNFVRNIKVQIFDLNFYKLYKNIGNKFPNI